VASSSIQRTISTDNTAATKNNLPDNKKTISGKSQPQTINQWVKILEEETDYQMGQLLKSTTYIKIREMVMHWITKKYDKAKVIEAIKMQISRDGLKHTPSYHRNFVDDWMRKLQPNVAAHQPAGQPFSSEDNATKAKRFDKIAVMSPLQKKVEEMANKMSPNLEDSRRSAHG